MFGVSWTCRARSCVAFVFGAATGLAASYLLLVWLEARCAQWEQLLFRVKQTGFTVAAERAPPGPWWDVLSRYQRRKVVVVKHLLPAEQVALRLPTRGPGNALSRGEVIDFVRAATHVRELGLSSLSLSDREVLGMLEGKHVVYLWLAKNCVTEGILPAIVSQTKLEVLNLDAMPLTDAGLARLSALGRLFHLSVADSRVTDRGLKANSWLAQLSQLDVAGTSVGDPGVEALADGRLEYLYLSRTCVSDAVVPTLIGMKRLQLLSIEGTAITDDGVRRLASARPDLDIRR